MLIGRLGKQVNLTNSRKVGTAHTGILWWAGVCKGRSTLFICSAREPEVLFSLNECKGCLKKFARTSDFWWKCWGDKFAYAFHIIPVFMRILQKSHVFSLIPFSCVDFKLGGFVGLVILVLAIKRFQIIYYSDGLIIVSDRRAAAAAAVQKAGCSD